MNTNELVLSQESLFSGALTGDVIQWKKESQFAIQALGNNKFLSDIAIKNQASLQNAIINVAAIGISLNPALKHAYLVPRDGKVCLDVSYMGLLSLAMSSGAIEWGQAKLVYQNDEYENIGIDKAPIHKQQTFGDKGAVVGVYCTVKTSSGDYLTEEMDIDALNKVKSTSKAANGPWKTWPEEMMRKTVVKRASKYWPNCEAVGKAVNVLNAHEGIDIVNEDNLTLAIRANSESIKVIKESIDAGELSTAAEAWFELDEEAQMGLWVAPSKGGPFSTEHRKIMTSSEFRVSHFGDNQS